MLLSPMLRLVRFTNSGSVREHGRPPARIAGRPGRLPEDETYPLKNLSFPLPLVLGISMIAFVMTAVITLAPTGGEIRGEAALMRSLSPGEPE